MSTWAFTIEAEMMERTKAFRGRTGLVCERPKGMAPLSTWKAVANLHNIQTKVRRCLHFICSCPNASVNYILHYFRH